MKLTTSGPLGRSLVFAALVGLVLGQADQSLAATLGISPVRVVLSASVRSTLVTLSNKTDDESQVEVSVSTWAEDGKGQAVLAPSEDLSVFPLLVTIPPRGEKRVRVGLAKRDVVVTERTYRLFLQELPPSKAGGEQAGVRMVMRFSLPVYVQPSKPAAIVSAEGLAVEGGHARFRLVNAGNAHAKLTEAVLTGKDPGGAITFAKSLDVRVLLAGGRRELDVPLSLDECLPSATLELRLLADSKALSAGAAVQATTCGG
jgi:fimbrial chaperone protein